PNSWKIGFIFEKHSAVKTNDQDKQENLPTLKMLLVAPFACHLLFGMKILKLLHSPVRLKRKVQEKKQ
ncbi:hypothetical protein CEXT_786191, partial [Caerostris extrusa]